ncbi:unnamed protein product [Paramecium primaurelia]|uniref:Uncharacterized protein n=2 Tax=Paramecium TaxID=5884 RepID=A0A8S1UVS9_9CILI|nr:unnamed protein product [Paramecium primaurelia]CAD8168293.1 unnamed protein product [Paramecium pentaurelia]
MNYVIKQTEQFLRALKTCHSIDQNLHCYFSNEGILLLSNYEQFEDVDTKKPTFFCYFNSTSFEQVQTNSIHFKMPQTLSPDLQIKLQKLNASLDKLVFELNILQLYTSLKPFKKQIKRIEIQVYYTISQLRVIQKFKMIVFFKDSFFTIECPIIQLDEIQQMELIRKYMENRRHLEVLEVDSEISEYLNDFNQKEAIQFILKRNSIEIHLNSQKQETTLELNSGFLTQYKFDDFTNIYKNVNTINIEPNVLTPFHGYGFKISISKDVNQKPRIFISQDWQDQISMVLKSITSLVKKIKIISILDDDCNEDELLDIIAEYQTDRVQEQECQQIEEQQVRKKIKMNLKS